MMMIGEDELNARTNRYDQYSISFPNHYVKLLYLILVQHEQSITIVLCDAFHPKHFLVLKQKPYNKMLCTPLLTSNHNCCII
jgi:hypothetical protein